MHHTDHWPAKFNKAFVALKSWEGLYYYNNNIDRPMHVDKANVARMVIMAICITKGQPLKCERCLVWVQSMDNWT